MPNDVAQYLERARSCHHFLGEEPYDAERRAFLEERIKALCTGLDARLVQLQRKYSGQKPLLRKLSESASSD